MSLWLLSSPVVLASKSEIRRTVLQGAGLTVDVRPADLDERTLERSSETDDPAAVAGLLARAKARAVAASLPGRVVVGADQTLALGQQRFSKPRDRAGARAQLLALRGQRHSLHAAVAVVKDDDVLFEHCGAAYLTMRDFSEAFLEAYLDLVGAAALQSVGVYQLEKAGVQLFESVDGDHFTILGLPLVPLLGFFRNQGWLLR